MKAIGTSDWSGSFREGEGTISTASTVLHNHPYTFASRFEGAAGASPEELLAAAHAGCYNHALANAFVKHGLVVGTIRTRAEVDMSTDTVSPGVQGVHLVVEARMPDVSEDQFHALAERASRTCAISKALNVDITVAATLLR